MWRFRGFSPSATGQEPVSLGEGDMPLLGSGDRRELGFSDLCIKDEGADRPDHSRRRGMAMAMTGAVRGRSERLRRSHGGQCGRGAGGVRGGAGRPARIYAPRTLHRRSLPRSGGSVGTRVPRWPYRRLWCRRARFASRTGAFPMSTLREPYRIEGKKTFGLELARQLGWKLPDVIIYPAGGGLVSWNVARLPGVLRRRLGDGSPPRLYAVQSAGCAPVVRAFAPGRTVANHGPIRGPWRVSSCPCAARGVTHVTGDPGHWRKRDCGQRRGPDRTGPGGFRWEGVDVAPGGGAAVAAAVTLRGRGDPTRRTGSRCSIPGRAGCTGLRLP